MRAVIGAGPPARTPAASLRPVLGEGGRLSLAGPPGSVELLLQVLAVMLPVIPLLDQLRVLVFEVLDARVPRNPVHAQTRSDRRARRSPEPCPSYRYSYPNPAPQSC